MVQGRQTPLVGHIDQYLNEFGLSHPMENQPNKPVSLKKVLNDVSLESTEEKSICYSFMLILQTCNRF